MAEWNTLDELLECYSNVTDDYIEFQYLINDDPELWSYWLDFHDSMVRAGMHLA